MKYLRILALILAMLMCLSVGFAEEATDGDTDLFGVGSGLNTEELEEEIEEATDGEADEDDSSLYDTQIISQLDVDADEWLLSADLRAMLAVIMDFEMYSNPDFDVETLFDTYGQPVIYVNVPTDLDGLAVGVMYFYTEAELVVSATYLPILGQYSAFQTEISLDPGVVMEALSGEGMFTEYYEVTSDEYYNAISVMYDALNVE